MLNPKAPDLTHLAGRRNQLLERNGMHNFNRLMTMNQWGGVAQYDA
jgi:hypothetical protein